MNHRRLLPVLAIPALVVGLGACSPAGVAERLVEQGAGVDIDTGKDGSVTFSDDEGSTWTSDTEGNIRMESDDGTVELSQNAGLPEGFPSAQVPLLDDEITTATKMTTDDGVTYQIAMSVPDGAAAFAEAVDRLTSAGYSLDSESVTESGDSIFASAELNGPYQVFILVMGDSSENLFSYTVLPASG